MMPPLPPKWPSSSPSRLAVVFPAVAEGETVALAEGEADSTCGATQSCPLYFPRTASRRRVLRAGHIEHFVTVLSPSSQYMYAEPAAFARGVSAVLTESSAEVTIGLRGGAVRVRVQLGDGKDKGEGWNVTRKPNDSV